LLELGLGSKKQGRGGGWRLQGRRGRAGCGRSRPRPCLLEQPCLRLCLCFFAPFIFFLIFFLIFFYLLILLLLASDLLGLGLGLSLSLEQRGARA
jgi:hypothetical protein